MKLTEEQIKEINSKCPYEQGIFREPFGIPNNIKEPVVYTKYDTGGRPGSCWDDEDTVNEPYTTEPPEDKWAVLDATLAILKPNISYLQYKTLTSLIESNENREWGYYGDYTDETIEYILLSSLERAIALMD